MKVLHIINELCVDGGAENLVKDLTLKMNANGIITDILILRNCSSALVKELQDRGINVYNTGLNKIYSFRQIPRIMKMIGGYDIVHTHLFPSQYWYAISKLIKKSNAKSVTTEHSTSNRRRNKLFFEYPEKFIYNRYDKIICISKGTEKELLEWIPSIKNKTITINNGIDIGKFRDCKAYQRELLIPGIDHDSKLILMVARMDIQKDFETLILAAKTLPTNYHVILVGDGPLMSKLKDLTSQSELSERVHFLGVRDDVNRIMKTVDLFVLSSNWEGFGLVAVEAMASGLPVIASDVTGLSDIVNGYGVLFKKGDYAQLAMSILDIFIHKGRYQNISQSCMNRAQHFSIDRLTDEYIKVYEDLLMDK